MKTTLNRMKANRCVVKGCKNEVVLRVFKPTRMYADMLIKGKWDEIHNSDDYDNEYDDPYYDHLCLEHGDEQYPFLYVKEIWEDTND